MDPTIEKPAVLASRLEALVRGLALPGGRRVGQLGHGVAEEWVAAQLRALELDCYQGDCHAQPNVEEVIHFTNFAGLIPGRDQSLAPLLIGAHYDSVIARSASESASVSAAIHRGERTDG